MYMVNRCCLERLPGWVFWQLLTALTTSEGLAKGPYVAARVVFKPATFGMHGTEPLPHVHIHLGQPDSALSAVWFIFFVSFAFISCSSFLYSVSLVSYATVVHIEITFEMLFEHPLLILSHIIIVSSFYPLLSSFDDPSPISVSVISLHCSAVASVM